MKIGIVDVDVSHPLVWVPIERELGHEVVGVWDGGSVHSKAYVEKFAADFQIPSIYDSLAQMACDVDCAVIHGCNWDTHTDKARPFVEKGKSVLLDKPLAGNTRDLKQIRTWSEQDARITGGSSLRFCYELRDWLVKPVSERGTAHTALCGCGVDDFNYGIHAYSLLSGIMGPGIHSVRHLGLGIQRRVQVNWADGRMGFVVVGKQEAWLTFYASITTEKTSFQFQADNTKLYRALLEAVLPYLAHETEQPPVPMFELIEPELAAIAARKSWLENDREVFLSELNDSDPGYNGTAFAEEYRRQRYPS